MTDEEITAYLISRGGYPVSTGGMAVIGHDPGTSMTFNLSFGVDQEVPVGAVYPKETFDLSGWEHAVNKVLFEALGVPTESLYLEWERRRGTRPAVSHCNIPPIWHGFSRGPLRYDFKTKLYWYCLWSGNVRENYVKVERRLNINCEPIRVPADFKSQYTTSWDDL